MYVKATLVVVVKITVPLIALVKVIVHVTVRATAHAIHSVVAKVTVHQNVAAKATAHAIHNAVVRDNAVAIAIIHHIIMYGLLL